MSANIVYGTQNVYNMYLSEMLYAPQIQGTEMVEFLNNLCLCFIFHKREVSIKTGGWQV